MIARTGRARELRLELSILGVFAGIFLLFLIGNPRTFTSFDIYYSFMSTIPFSGIMALAITLVIVSGEMDLSFPSIMGFSGWVFAKLSNVLINSGTDPTLAIIIATLCCFATGLVGGALNGSLVITVRIPSLVATIGTMFFWRGLVNVCGQGFGETLVPVKETFLFKAFVGRLGNTIPAQAIWFVFLAVIFWLILKRHRFGTHVLIVGDNLESARMMGIRVHRVKLFVFMQMGFFASLAGILASLEVTYLWPSLGEGYLLRTLAAVFVGGTSVFGGMGTIFGTFIGAIIIGSLEGGIVAIGLTGFWTQLIYGLIIVVSLSIYSYFRQRE
ncbi:MAG: sugar ABC transporter permease [Spirochaetes bacterium DG_61]|nr:MAG: sugar ABC transporter permease [Spirochaetes bacterium DG_61]